MANDGKFTTTSNELRIRPLACFKIINKRLHCLAYLASNVDYDSNRLL